MKKLLTLLQFILIFTIAFSLIKLKDYSLNLKETEEIEIISRNMWETQIKATYTFKNIEVEKIEENQLQATLEFLGNLKDKYPDTVSYINIENTNISYPVVQANDNNYYLSHSPNKKHNPNGSIFMSYLNNSDFSDDNTILYGHNVHLGKMFQNLHKFKEQSFYDEVNTIELQTKEGIKLYRIISVYKTQPEYQYKTPNYLNLEEKNAFINDIIQRSIITTLTPDYLFTDKAKLITLSTCEIGGKYRLVVHGVEITN